MQAASKLKGLEVMKEVGRRWKAIKPRDKVRYENKANVDKQRYNQEMAKFNSAMSSVISKTQENAKQEDSGEPS